MNPTEVALAAGAGNESSASNRPAAAGVSAARPRPTVACSSSSKAPVKPQHPPSSQRDVHGSCAALALAAANEVEDEESIDLHGELEARRRRRKRVADDPIDISEEESLDAAGPSRQVVAAARAAEAAARAAQAAAQAVTDLQRNAAAKSAREAASEQRVAALEKKVKALRKRHKRDRKRLEEAAACDVARDEELELEAARAAEAEMRLEEAEARDVARDEELELEAARAAEAERSLDAAEALIEELHAQVAGRDEDLARALVRLEGSAPVDPAQLAGLSATELAIVRQRLVAGLDAVAAAAGQGTLCVACLAQRPSVLAMPCKHLALCGACFDEHVARQRVPACALCRAILDLAACVKGAFLPS